MAAEGFSRREVGLAHVATMAALLTLIVMLSRVLGLGPPMVFADEFGYAAWAESLHAGLPAPLEMAAALNNWLYLRIYALVFWGDGSFLVSARVLNAVFTAAAAAVLMPLFACQAWQRPRALGTALAIGYAVAIAGGYAAYFMPETPYFTMVCLLGLAVWGYGRQSRAWMAAMAGVAGGLATMMKSHGMLLLPGTLLAIAACGWSLAFSSRRLLLHACACGGAWLATTTLLAMTLGLDAGFNPIGKFYMDTAGISATNAGSSGAAPLVGMVALHVAVLTATLGLPLFVCICLAIDVARKRTAPDMRPLATLASMLLPSLAGMVLVTCVFSVGIAGTSALETLDRLHGRYYEHLSQLAACVGVVAATPVMAAWSGRRRSIVAAALVLAVAAAFWILRPLGWQNPNDFAAVFAMFASPQGRWLAVALPCCAAMAALYWPRRASMWLGMGLLAWLAYGTWVLDGFWSRFPVSPVDRVASVLAGIELGDDRSRVMIVAPPVQAYRAGFLLSEEDTTISFPEMHPYCDARRRPEWVVTVAPAADPCSGVEVLRIDDVAISYVK